MEMIEVDNVDFACCDSPLREKDESDTTSAEEDSDDQDRVYEVSSITGSRWNGTRSCKEYRVAWKGFKSPEEDSWEPQENLAGAKELINEYERVAALNEPGTYSRRSFQPSAPVSRKRSLSSKDLKESQRIKHKSSRRLAANTALESLTCVSCRGIHGRASRKVPEDLALRYDHSRMCAVCCTRWYTDGDPGLICSCGYINASDSVNPCPHCCQPHPQSVNSTKFELIAECTSTQHTQSATETKTCSIMEQVRAMDKRVKAGMLKLEALQSNSSDISTQIQEKIQKIEAQILERRRDLEKKQKQIDTISTACNVTLSGVQARCSAAEASINNFRKQIEMDGLHACTSPQDVSNLFMIFGHRVSTSQVRQWKLTGGSLLRWTELDMQEQLGIELLGDRRRFKLALQRLAVRQGEPNLQGLHWNVDRVGEWLDDIGFGEYKDGFKSHRIDGEILITLARDDLKILGVESISVRDDLQSHIEDLKCCHTAPNKMSDVDVPMAELPETARKALLQELLGMSKNLRSIWSNAKKRDIKLKKIRYFCCPITAQVMTDPVVAMDGLTYERDFILAWLASNTTSPISGKPISSTLIPNVALHREITAKAAYVAAHRSRKHKQAEEPYIVTKKNRIEGNTHIDPALTQNALKDQIQQLETNIHEVHTFVQALEEKSPGLRVYVKGAVGVTTEQKLRGGKATLTLPNNQDYTVSGIVNLIERSFGAIHGKELTLMTTDIDGKECTLTSQMITDDIIVHCVYKNKT